MKLKVQSVINGYNGPKATGTLVIFAETHADGEYKGKNITHWSSNPDFVMESDQGWTYDKENDRVIAPVVTRLSQRKADLELMHSLGMEIRL